MNAVTCMTWVQRGVTKAIPDKVKLSEDDIAALVRSAKGEDDDDELVDEEEIGASNAVDDNDMPVTVKLEDQDKSAAFAAAHEVGKQVQDTVSRKYNLDNYDDSDDDSNTLSMAGLSFYTSNANDPYLNKADHSDGQSSSDEDMRISVDDDLIAIGKVHGDHFSLEVWVHNEAQGILYCHHDTILTSFPLAIEWVGFSADCNEAATSDNFVAIGSMETDIDLWDLDVVNTIEPAFVLKGEHSKKKKKNSQRGSKKPKLENTGRHKDAVLGLAWNRLNSQVLASGSADTTVVLWDLRSAEPVSVIRAHSDKVQAVQWHPAEAQTLLSGDFSGCVKVSDCRAPDSCKTWLLNGEVERVLWNRHDPYQFYASNDAGQVFGMDVRNTDPVFTLSAHSAAVTGLALSSVLPSCLLTASDDRTVKLWDVHDWSKAPTLVCQRNCKIGAIHCAAASYDASLTFAVGGDREMKVLNLRADQKVAEHFCTSADDGAARPVELSETGDDFEAKSMARKKSKSKRKQKVAGKKTKPKTK